MLGDLRGVPFPPRNSGSFNFPAFSLYNKGNSGSQGRTGTAGPRSGSVER